MVVLFVEMYKDPILSMFIVMGNLILMLMNSNILIRNINSLVNYDNAMYSDSVDEFGMIGCFFDFHIIGDPKHNTIHTDTLSSFIYLQNSDYKHKN